MKNKRSNRSQETLTCELEIYREGLPLTQIGTITASGSSYEEIVNRVNNQLSYGRVGVVRDITSRFNPEDRVII